MTSHLRHSHRHHAHRLHLRTQSTKDNDASDKGKIHVNAMLQAAALHIGQALAAYDVVHNPYVGIPDANHLAMALLFVALWPTVTLGI